MSNALLTARQGAVMTVTMNRPDQLNILGEPGDGDAFRKVFDAINEDRSIVENIDPSCIDGKYNMKFDKLQNIYRSMYKKHVHIPLKNL